MIFFTTKYKMDIPHYIFDILNKELIDLQKELLKKVAIKYNIDYNTLINDFIEAECKNVKPNTSIQIQVKKQIVRKNIVEPEIRCMARIWNRGKGGQCTKKRMDINECLYCKQHLSNRKHGSIKEPPDLNLFPFQSCALYK